MRYPRLIVSVSLCIWGLLPSVSLALETRSPSLTAQATQADFWTPAQQLLQEQLNLIERVERSLAQPDPNQVKSARIALTFHIIDVERFLRQQYRLPQFLCDNNPNTNVQVSYLNQTQQQVYCNLYNSTLTLQPLIPFLDRLIPTLSGNIVTPVVPEFPEPEPPVIGLPAKEAIADAPEIIIPLITPPAEAIVRLEAVRQETLTTTQLFPPSARFNDPLANRERLESTYEVSPLEILLYDEFLTEPNTGIAPILPETVYRSKINRVGDRVLPSFTDISVFPPLKPLTEAFLPRLTLEVDKENFAIPMPSLNYGFMVSLGDIPLDNVATLLAKRAILTPEERECFFIYRPPQQLATIQADQRRFFFHKLGNGEVPPLELPVFSELPAKLNHTYLLRLIQYQLPEPVITGEPITRENRRNAREILETPSSDIIIAFRPVRQRANGGYTIVWRIITEFPDPQITDLEKYVQLE
ncbi:MAG: hypothetical protein SAL07_10635 [Oscillatoria sp. PMC 1051.18]|nr:hypothetical protein [Oscillatoria sp. PMC 1050.18]MEC5030360.1 hypothetical protein [Oscillatoria sp. PMC 1051.18]